MIDAQVLPLEMVVARLLNQNTRMIPFPEHPDRFLDHIDHNGDPLSMYLEMLEGRL